MSAKQQVSFQLPFLSKMENQDESVSKHELNSSNLGILGQFFYGFFSKRSRLDNEMSSFDVKTHYLTPVFFLNLGLDLRFAFKRFEIWKK